MNSAWTLPVAILFTPALCSFHYFQITGPVELFLQLRSRTDQQFENCLHTYTKSHEKIVQPDPTLSPTNYFPPQPLRHHSKPVLSHLTSL
jgi:hypothetical protein